MQQASCDSTGQIGCIYETLLNEPGDLLPNGAVEHFSVDLPKNINEKDVDIDTAKDISDFVGLKNLYINLPLSREAMDKITTLKSLKTLALTNDEMQITHEDINAVANFDHLENLSLNFGDPFDLHASIAIQMANNQNDQNKIKDAMNTLFIKQESALKRLKIRSKYGTDTSIGILETLDLCKNLEVFSNGKLTLNKAEFEALGRLTKLKNLKLDLLSMDPTITHKAYLIAFVKNGSFEELETLSLAIESLDDEAMKCLYSRSLPKLKCLNLNHCEKLKLNDDLLIKLADSCPNLKFLHLLGVELSLVSDEVIFDLWRNRKIIVKSTEKEISLLMYMKNNGLSEELSQYRKDRDDSNSNEDYLEMQMDIDYEYLF